MLKRLQIWLLISAFILASGLTYSQDHFGIMDDPGSGLENQLMIDANDNIFLAVWGIGLYYSNNNGTSFNQVGSGLTNTYITDICHNPNGDIFVSTFGGGLFKSTDNGVTFSEANTGISNLFANAIIAIDNNLLFAGTYGSGLFISNDNGATWQETNEGVKFRDIRTLEYFETNGFIVAGTYGDATYMTRDTGKTWKREKTGMTNYYINDFIMNNQDEILAASNGRGLLVSVNQGISYAEYDSLMQGDFYGPEALPDYNFTCVALNTMNEPIIGTRSHGIFKYDRFTYNHWQFTNVRTEGITDIAVNSQNHFFAVRANNELVRSTDDGDTWDNLGDVVEDKEATIFAHKNGKIFLFRDNEVFLSTDYGYDFDKRGDLDGHPTFVMIDSSGALWVAAGNGLKKSVNDGNTFTGEGYADTTITGLATNDNGEIFVGWQFVTQVTPPAEPQVYSGIDLINGPVKLRIRDGAPDEVFSSFMTDDADGLSIVNSKGSINRTTDLGQSWSSVSGYLGKANSIDRDHNNKFYVSTDEGVYETENFGATWTSYEIDVPGETNENYRNVIVTPQDEMYVRLTAKRSVFQYDYIYKTDDEGDTWQRVDGSITNTGIKGMVMNPEGDIFAYTNQLYKAFNPVSIEEPNVLSPMDGDFAENLTPEIIWEPAFKAELYELEISNKENFSFIWDYVVQSDTTFKIQDTLEHNVTYYYRLRSKTHDAYSDWTEGSFKTSLNAVTLLSPANDSSCIERLTELMWAASNGATKYIVQLSDSMNFNNLIIEDTTENLTYTTPQLNGNTKYYWKIKAINDDTQSAWSKVWSFTTVLNPADLVYPFDGQLNIDLTDTLKFNIEYNSDLYNYAYVKIYEDESMETLIDSSAVNTDSTYIMNSTEYNKEYWWYVGIVTDCEQEVISEVYHFNTLLTPVVLESPADGSSSMPTDVTLTWEAHSELQTYHLIVATDEDFENVILDISEIIDLSYDLTGLENNNRFFWKVMAYGEEFKSAWSETWSFTTLLTKPQLRSPADSTQNLSTSVTLLWFEVDGAEFYQLQVSRDKEFNDLIFSQDSIDAVKRDFEGLEPNSWYFWRVRAMSETGMTDWSEIWAFKTSEFVPILISPENNATDIDLPVTFTWNGFESAEKYHLQIANDENFDDLVLSKEDITNTEYTATELTTENTYYWRVRTINGDFTSEWSDTYIFTVGDGNSVYDYVDTEISVYPNPASDYINIRLFVNQISNIRLTVIDASGRYIDEIDNKQMSKGEYNFRWNTGNNSQGTYFLLIEADGSAIQRQINIIR